jgi:peptide alpha-N-acetyltransferase
MQRLPLYFVSGLRFSCRIDKYLRKCLRKGIPSLFRMMRPLYFQKGKADIVEGLILQYIENLSKEVSWFGKKPDEKSAEPPAEQDEEAPSTLLFAYMVAAEHYDFLGEVQKALEYADKAIEHTPTFVEIYACKARIYKHAGNLEESAKWFDEVRSMDLADRYLNTQCVRAFLRIDDVPSGMEKALLFSHSKETDAPECGNLHDMQCMAYESAVGRSFYRQQNYGKALKEFGETFKHFNDIAEDQFDFHNYCLRKTTLKAYVNMLRMQERLYSHKFYRRAAKDAIRIYVEIWDQKQRGEGPAAKKEEAEEETKLTASEMKALKHKQKRSKKKADDEIAEKNKTAAGGKPKKVDDDPEGEKLIEKDQMEESQKLVRNLVLYSDLDPVTHVLSYDVFSRQKKWLHCLQALIRLWRLSGDDVLSYKLITPLAHFCFEADLENKDMNVAVREVILAEMATLLGEAKPFKDVKAVRAAASKKVVDPMEKRLKEQSDLPLIEVLYGLKCLKNAGRDCKGFLEKWKPTGAFSLKECNKMLAYLDAGYGKDSKIWLAFKDKCLEVFPLMVIA